MDHPRDDVFACAAFTGNQDRDIGRSHPGQLSPDCLQRLRAPKNDVVRGDLTEGLLQRSHRKCRHIDPNAPCAGYATRMH